jgi:hypothetical protein
MKKLILVCTTALFLSCGSNTTIVDSWRNPDTTISQEQFKKVLVVCLIQNETNRRVAENTVVQIRPTLFHPSYDLYDQSHVSLTPEQKHSILVNEGYDGVITMRLVDKNTEVTYVPGTTTYAGYYGHPGYYGGVYGAYGAGYAGWYGAYGTAYYDPGYYQENNNYIVETNVFSVKSNKLLWTGTTKTVDPTDVSSTVTNIMHAVVDNMRKSGTIPPK